MGMILTRKGQDGSTWHSHVSFLLKDQKKLHLLQQVTLQVGHRASSPLTAPFPGTCFCQCSSSNPVTVRPYHPSSERKGKRHAVYEEWTWAHSMLWINYYFPPLCAGFEIMFIFHHLTVSIMQLSHWNDIRADIGLPCVVPFWTIYYEKKSGQVVSFSSFSSQD